MKQGSRRLIGAVVLAAASLAVVWLVAACTATTPKYAFNYGEMRLRLNNGLRLVLVPDKSTQLVEVDVRYEVGSREDPPGKAGLAHLVEHMMFQLRPDGPQTPALFQFVNQLSVFFNAFTNWDSTHYMTNARAESLEALLKIEAMRLYYGCQTIPEDEFLREREVVRNEIRQRGGTADGQIPQLVLSAVYPKGHAYEHDVGGDDRQLASITLADTCAFIKKYYVPSRATLIIAGGIDPTKTRDMVVQWFGKIEKRDPAPRREVAPVAGSSGRITHDLDIDRPVVVVAWPLPASNTPDGEAAQFGIWGAFFGTAAKTMEYEYATQVSPLILGGAEAPVFAVAVELKSLKYADDAIDFVWKAARRAHEGYDSAMWEQLEQLRARRKASFIQGIEALPSRTVQLGELVQFQKEVDFDSADTYIGHELKKIDEFDGERIERVVARALDPSRGKVIVFRASHEGLKGDRRADLKFQTQTHEGGEIPEVDPTEAKRPLKVSTELSTMTAARRFELGNGMHVVLLPVDGMPIVAAQLIFDVGDAHSTGAPGTADSAARYLQPPMDATAMFRTGVFADCETNADHTICSSRGMNIYLEIVLRAIERLVRVGSYDQRGLEQRETLLRAQLATPTARQQIEFQRQYLTALYGPDHPYTRTGVTAGDWLKGVGVDELNDFRDRHYTAANATLVIAGNFELARGEALAREVFGDWDRGGHDKPIAPDLRKRTGPEYIGVVGKSGPQMTVRIAFPAPAGIDGVEGAREVLVEMLNERMGAIRERLGATYGTYAGRAPRVGPASYGMGGNVDAERAGEALKAMREGVESLRRGDDFAIDFVRARRKIMQELLGESTVSAELAARLGFIARYHLEPGYYNTLLQRVAAASPAHIRALIAAELRPENEIIVAMADRPTLEKAFTEAGITSFKIIEPE